RLTTPFQSLWSSSDARIQYGREGGGMKHTHSSNSEPRLHVVKDDTVVCNYYHFSLAIVKFCTWSWPTRKKLVDYSFFIRSHSARHNQSMRTSHQSWYFRNNSCLCIPSRALLSLIVRNFGHHRGA
ncbi:hypothetical protein T310_9202, partial [Rasamsonia emersonii CBS 393.64]